MKPEDKKAIAEGAKALGADITSEQVDKLAAYLELLLKWNRVFNLTSIRTVREGILKHVLDSLSLVPYLKREGAQKPASIVDVGSGGGFPAAVLAICMPEVTVYSVDAVAKKSAFVTQAASQLSLPNLKAKHCRIEEIGMVFDMAVCRAFSSLKLFSELTDGCVKPGGVWVAMKGKKPEAEIAELPEAFRVTGMTEVFVPGLGEERTFVEFRRAFEA